MRPDRRCKTSFVRAYHAFGARAESGQAMRLEHGGDRLAVPPEDELLDRSCWPNATGPEDRHAFSTFAPDAVVGDTVRIPRPELGS